MKTYIADIQIILEQARKQAYSSINTAMIEAYWKIGKRIVEEEQNGTERAGYGKEIIKNISLELGKGFSERTLREYRQFYQTFPSWEDLAHACAKLQWSHFRLVMRISNKMARTYYLQEAAAENWSVRTLDRNISTLYYQRLLSSQEKEPVKKEMLDKIENTARNMGCSEDRIKHKHINNCYKVDPAYGRGVADALGISYADAGIE